MCRSRSTATISPHQSVVTSSTTAPSGAGASIGATALGRAPVGGEDVGAVAVARSGRKPPGHARWDRARSRAGRAGSVLLVVRAVAPARPPRSPRARRRSCRPAGRARRGRPRRSSSGSASGLSSLGWRSSGRPSSVMPSGSRSDSLMVSTSVDPVRVITPSERHAHGPTAQISGSRFWPRGAARSPARTASPAAPPGTATRPRRAPASTGTPGRRGRGWSRRRRRARCAGARRSPGPPARRGRARRRCGVSSPSTSRGSAATPAARSPPTVRRRRGLLDQVAGEHARRRRAPGPPGRRRCGRGRGGRARPSGRRGRDAAPRRRSWSAGDDLGRQHLVAVRVVGVGVPRLDPPPRRASSAAASSWAWMGPRRTRAERARCRTCGRSAQWVLTTPTTSPAPRRRTSSTTSRRPRRTPGCRRRAGRGRRRPASR